MDKYKLDFVDKNGKPERKFSADFVGFANKNKCDISDKIKNLELEGLKLRSQVEDILAESGTESWRSTDNQSVESSKTCHEDFGRYEPHYKTYQPDHVSYNQGGNINDNAQYMEYMQQKLRQISSVHQQEKEKLLGTIDEFKRVNFQLQSDLELQAKEIQESEIHQHSMIEKLRSNLSQVISINKRQEETLKEAAAKLEEVNGSQSSTKTLEYLREVLLDAQYNGGISLVKDYDVETSAPNMLVNTVEKYFREYNSEIDNKSRRIKHLEDEILEVKRCLMHDKEKSLLSLRNQLVYTEEQNSYLKQRINESNDRADCEIERLREENSNIQIKMEDGMMNATKLIDGLEQNIKDLAAKNKQLSESWISEKKSLEKVLDDNEKQIVIIKAERDQAINQKSSITAKLDATQNQLSETESSLLHVQSEKYHLQKKIEASTKLSKTMENTISSCRKYFDHIFQTIRPCRTNNGSSGNNCGDSEDSFFDNDESEENDQLWKPKKHEIEEVVNQIKCLKRKEKELVAQNEKLLKEIELIQKQLESTDLNRRQIDQSFKAQQLDIDSAKNENDHLNSLIANRNGEIERLTAERDYYFQLLNEKTEEVASLKTEKHRLTVSLEERCRLLETQNNSNQNSNNNQRNDNKDCSPGKNRILRDDRNRLTSELKNMKATYEELLLRFQEESRNLQMTRQENWGLQKDLKMTSRDYDDAALENKKLKMKLKDSEQEIISLCQELQKFNVIKSRKDTNLEKKVSELIAEVTSYKNELKIAQERIKCFEKARLDSKRPQFTVLNDQKDSMDNQSTENLKMTKGRLNNLEEQMINLDSNQQNLKEENYKLTDLLKKVTSQNERLSEELENYVEENRTLRSQIRIGATDPSSTPKKSKSVPKKDNSKSHRQKPLIMPSTQNSSNESSNDESIKKLREDLQISIQEAKRLLSCTNLIEPCEDKSNLDVSTPKPSQSKISTATDSNSKISENVNHSATDSYGLSTIKTSDSVNSSSLNTRRSESTSLTEADRYLTLPMNKSKGANDCLSTDVRSVSPIEELLSPNKNHNVRLKKSNRDSYLLEEKIKRILAAES